MAGYINYDAILLFNQYTPPGPLLNYKKSAFILALSLVKDIPDEITKLII